MTDFIVEHIPTTSTDINNIQYITNTAASANITTENNNNTGSNSPLSTNNATIPSNTSLIPIDSPINTTTPALPTATIATTPSTPARNARTRANNLEEQENILSKVISKVDIYKQLFDDCYKPIRFTDYNNWMQIGMAIKNTIPDTNQAIELYIYYSARAANFPGNQSVIDKFNSFKKTNNGLGIGTIYKMALEDNKENAIRILGNSKLQLLTQYYCRFIKALAGNRFFYRIYGENNYKLYCYNGRYWESNLVRLREFIGQELYDLLRQILVDVYSNDFINKNS